MKEPFQVQLPRGAIHGVTLHPLESPVDDPVLLFLHDALGSVEQWKAFPERISTALGLRAVVYDRLGHGKSDAMPAKRGIDYLHLEARVVLRQLIQKLELHKVILIGHSDGASIALLYASMFDDVCAVAAMAPHVMVEELTREGIRNFKRVYDEKGLATGLQRFHGAKTAALFDAWHDTWLSPEFASWNIVPEMSRIRQALLLIQGQSDEYGSAAQIESIARNVQQSPAQLLLPNCAHFPHVTARRIVEEAICRFVSGLL
ncbi:MAG: alpha/beta hydrolase [Leptospirales bacterium]|nr:alpha/beta hydrolase [Leptospirales bacterium]